MMPEEKIRGFSKSLASTREIGKVLGVSHSKVWLWQQGVGKFRDDQLDVLEQFLAGKLQARLAGFEEIVKD